MTYQKQIENAVNEAVARSIAKRVVREINSQLGGKWGMVVQELAATRKDNELMRQQIEKLYEFTNRIASVVQTVNAKAAKTKELQQKETRILDFLTREFGIKTEEEQ